MPESRSAGIAGRIDPLLPVLLLLLSAPAALAQLILSEGTNISADVSREDGRVVIDLLGSLWVVPPGGGAAKKLSDGTQPAARPRWSPGNDAIAYQTSSSAGSRIAVLDVSTGASSHPGAGSHYDQQPAWHPDGRRIVFSSARGDSGFDIWETHLRTGLSWRMSGHAGDETEPVWSENGRDLAYIHHENDQWRLVLRRHGQPEQELVVSDEPLAAPSWRPDGSLLTFLQRDANGSYSLQMVILSDPPLIRRLAAGEDFFLSPVSWRDRLRLIYTADGMIKERRFNDWKSSRLRFSAELPEPDRRQTALAAAAPALAIVSPSSERLVIRAARLFDGVDPGYRLSTDVLIEDGTVTAVEKRRDWKNATVLDLGDSTILPGFIDVYAALPEGDPGAVGLAILSYGVTTVVAGGVEGYDASLWESGDSPGPRLLRAAPLATTNGAGAEKNEPRLSLLTMPGDHAALPTGLSHLKERPVALPLLAESWRVGLAVDADLLLGAETLPASPLGRRYRDLQLAQRAGPVALVSGLADGATPGLEGVLQSRQADAFRHRVPLPRSLQRRFATIPDLSMSPTVVIGSRPSGLPAGAGLHAEMRALAAAGLRGDDILRAAGANASDVLGLGQQLGHIAPGALADLVLVAGDPRERVSDALNIVAVVRNGRFYSLVRLLEQAGGAGGVE
ncbi:MAG: amidohydrolase family protein [Woeseia sp.]